MKHFTKIALFILITCMLCGGFALLAFRLCHEAPVSAAEAPKATDEPITIRPQYINGRVMLPVRELARKINAECRSVSGGIVVKGRAGSVLLEPGSAEALVNGVKTKLASAPVVIDGKAWLPVSSAAAAVGYDALYDSKTRMVTLVPVAPKLPVVYIIHSIDPQSLMKIYRRLDFTPKGKVAIKLSTGEAGNTHYLDPRLIKPLVQSVHGTIVECNTAYGGARAETAMHRQVAQDHGFTGIAEVDIMDSEGSVLLPVDLKDSNIAKGNLVGSHLRNYDSMITLSHFKGHGMAGFGGAIKNMSIGIASSSGKLRIHTGGKSDTAWGGNTQEAFLESMADATYSVVKYLKGNITYISVMNHLSVDCDCASNPAKPEMKDVGILASNDPVALDQACIDIVYAADRKESGALVERIESRNGLHTLERAAEIDLGSREYQLVSLDE